MNLGKTLALTAVSGMLMGLAGCAGGTPDAKSAEGAAAAGAKECCKGKNECANKGNCKVEGQNDCAGKNKCKGKGGDKSGPGCVADAAAKGAPAAK
jgi:hypothetical protein